MSVEAPTRAGFVAILGRPNAGKSTLMNALIGEHLAAVSSKVQTTRHRIQGFWTEGDTQIVFVDTPGLLDPAYPLQKKMMEAAVAAIEGVDAVYWLVDHDEPSDEEYAVLRRIAAQGIPLFLVLTKDDQVPEAKLAARERGWASVADWRDRFRISAVTHSGLEELIRATRDLLPRQAFFYPADQLTDVNLRFVASEMIREACYVELGKELPYSIHVAIDEWKDPVKEAQKTLIEATVFVERESQKGIVIGGGGKKLKAIGSAARLAIESLVGGPVFLRLRVKVRKKWTRREADLKFFGYSR